MLDLADRGQQLAALRPALEQLDEQPGDLAAFAEAWEKRSKNSRFCGRQPEPAIARLLPECHQIDTRRSGHGEVDRRGDPGDEAVDRERDQRPRLEEAHQEPHREVGGERRRRARRRAPGRGRRRPALPSSSGSLSSAAAPMIGVASRKAKRAASLFERPTSRPPPIVAPEREKPGISASACAAPTPNACASRPAGRSGCRRRRRSAARGGGAAPRRRAARRSASGRSPPTCGEANTLRSLSSQQRARGSRPGSCPTTSSQPSFASVSSGSIPGRAASGRAPSRSAPSRARRSRAARARSRDASRRGSVRKYLSFWWMFQPKRLGRITLWPRLEIGKSSETPWSSPEDDRLRVGDQRGEDHAAGLRRFGPDWNQAKTRQASAEQEGGDPVLHVVVARAGLVAREEARQRARRLDEVDDPRSRSGRCQGRASGHGEKPVVPHRAEHSDPPRAGHGEPRVTLAPTRAFDVLFTTSKPHVHRRSEMMPSAWPRHPAP